MICRHLISMSNVELAGTPGRAVLPYPSSGGMQSIRVESLVIPQTLLEHCGGPSTGAKPTSKPRIPLALEIGGIIYVCGFVKSNGKAAPVAASVARTETLIFVLLVLTKGVTGQPSCTRATLVLYV